MGPEFEVICIWVSEINEKRTTNGVEEVQKPRRSTRILSQLREKTRKEALVDMKDRSGTVKAENFEAQKGKKVGQ